MRIYQIQDEGKGRRLQQSSITVCKTLNNEIYLLQNGKELEYKEFDRKEKRPAVVDDKNLNSVCDNKLDAIKSSKPVASHPWRKFTFGNPAFKKSLPDFKRISTSA